MIKKIITGAAVFGLSVGIVSTAGAEELPETSLPIQGITTIQEDSPISTFNLQKQWSETRLYPQSEYLMADSTPNSVYVNRDGWVGTLYKSSIKRAGQYGDWWEVTYSGKLTLM